jgi:hypothetical protein
MKHRLFFFRALTPLTRKYRTVSKLFPFPFAWLLMLLLLQVIISFVMQCQSHDPRIALPANMHGAPRGVCVSMGGSAGWIP